MSPITLPITLTELFRQTFGRVVHWANRKPRLAGFRRANSVEITVPKRDTAVYHKFEALLDIS